MWPLKDREFEKKLNETSHPMHTFTDALNKKLDAISPEVLSFTYSLEVSFKRVDPEGVILDCFLDISTKEIEEAPDYNPNAWNEYPDVTPPEGVWMRVDFEDGKGSKARYSKSGDEYFWFAGNGMAFSKNMLIANPINRFRPWEG